MSLVVKPPNRAVAPLIEWRASRMENPVERLRFLQSAAIRCSRPVVQTSALKRVRWEAVLPFIMWVWLLVPLSSPSRSPLPVHPAAAALPADTPASAAWLIEQTDDFEIYSNGLRIEKEFASSNRPRGAFGVFRRTDPALEGPSEEPFDTRSEPVGIVYHSTESDQAPFEPQETRNLKRIGRSLLEYVKNRHSYHYVIDRFGRVFRVVEESDVANHAGRSVWADTKGTYVYLNASFIGVAIESQSDAGVLSTPQGHAVRVLTEMLRSKYTIVASNCVTHAQVSVNPSNHLIGYHTDWAAGFPFAAIGLPDNYKLPVAAMVAFGFEYDHALLGVAGGRLWPGLVESRRVVREQAMAAGVPAGEYQRHLNQRFQKILNSAAIREREENNEASQE